MRLTILVLVLGMNSLWASTGYSQSTKLTLKISDTRIEDVLNQIESQSEFFFLFNQKLIDVNRKVSIDAEDEKISVILDEIFAGTDVNHQVIDRQIILTTPATTDNPLSQQGKKIKGKVTDGNNAPLPGVTVVVKGTSVGVITDSNGNYFINSVPENASLQFSFVGMKTQEVKIGSQSTVNIVMVEETVGIEEIVAVGYGTTKKKDLTSSITTVSSKEFNVGAHTDMNQLLQGKVPGLNITKDGNPTGNTSVMLRGPSTLRDGAQAPLYVVDGVPGGIISSMDDVVSMDVLRDASAASIYGSRAANGVIIVTTKRGEENTSKISYNAYVGVETISNKIDMMSADEYRAFLKKNNLSLAPEDEDNVNTNWMDEVTRLGVSHNNNISIGGGTNKTTYFASATYKDIAGIIKETGVKNLSMMANVKQKAFNDRLKVGLTITSGITDSQYLPASPTDNGSSLTGNRDFLLNMINYLPTVSIKDAAGEYNENFSHPGAKNPVALLDQNDANNRTKNFMGTGQIQFNIIKGLDYELDASYQNTQSNYRAYFGKKSSLAQGQNGMAIRNSYEYETKLLETTMTYAKTFNLHDLKLLAGYSWQENVSGNGFQTSNKNFISDAISYNNLGLGSGASGFVPSYGSTAVQTLRMISGYARFNYAFNNKYLVQATVRRDGSSAFGANNKWGTFPSASIGWRVLEERFMKNQHIFDNLKLRAGYGVSGNSMGFDPLISKMRYSTLIINNQAAKFYSNGSFISAITPTQNENPDLKWESTSMLNIGIDFSVLKGRLSGTVEWYDKLTKDMLAGYAVPASQYYIASILANVGEMENKGWEVSLNAIPVKTKDFRWNSTFNISFNKNNVNSLSNDTYKLQYIKQAGVGEHGQSGNMVQIIQQGYPIGQFWLWKYAGHNAAGVSQFYKADGTLTVNPGPDDHFYMGNAQPKATGGWYNSFTYKNFSLDMLFRGVTGNKILDVTRADLNYPAEATHYNMPKMTADEPINDDRAHYASSRYLEDGDYIRLDNITLGYTFKMTKVPAIKNLRVYTSVNNVFVITGYKGMDPEVFMGSLTPGIDNDNFYPKTRTFIFGMNIDF